MRNQVITCSTSESVIVKLVRFMSRKNNFVSYAFSADLNNAFLYGMLLASLLAGAAIIVENTVELNGWCVAMWLAAFAMAIPCIKYYLRQSR